MGRQATTGVRKAEGRHARPGGCWLFVVNLLIHLVIVNCNFGIYQFVLLLLLLNNDICCVAFVIDADDDRLIVR